MKGSSGKIERRQFVIRNLDARRVGIAILDSSHCQAFFGCRMRNELKNNLKRDKRFGTPVDGNEGEEPVFDFVPFAGCRWIMSDRNRQVFLIGKLLQMFLP